MVGKGLAGEGIGSKLLVEVILGTSDVSFTFAANAVIVDTSVGLSLADHLEVDDGEEVRLQQKSGYVFDDHFDFVVCLLNRVASNLLAL